jgi:hypothetical protein
LQFATKARAVGGGSVRALQRPQRRTERLRVGGRALRLVPREQLFAAEVLVQDLGARQPRAVQISAAGKLDQIVHAQIEVEIQVGGGALGVGAARTRNDASSPGAAARVNVRSQPSRDRHLCTGRGRRGCLRCDGQRRGQRIGRRAGGKAVMRKDALNGRTARSVWSLEQTMHARPSGFGQRGGKVVVVVIAAVIVIAV